MRHNPGRWRSDRSTLVLSLYVVRDGFGLVVNLMSPPGDPDGDRALFTEWLGSWEWQP